MDRQILSSGTLLCSAALLYSWGQPSRLQSSVHPCEESLGSKNSMTATKLSPEAEQRCLKKATIAISHDPPQLLLNLPFSKSPSNQLPSQMEEIYENLLKHAQASSNHGQFAQAIATVAGIPKNSQHYEMAQRLQEDWAQELLQQATHEWHQAHMVKAISLLNVIPPTSQLGDRVPEIRKRWHQQAKQLNQAIAAQKAGDWQGVMTALQPLESTPLQNSSLVQELLQQAMIQPYEPDGTLMQIASEGMPSVQGIRNGE